VLSNLRANQVLRNNLFFKITTENRIAQFALGFFMVDLILAGPKYKLTPSNLHKDANLNDTFMNYDAKVLILGCSKKIL
jgi:hypothetical protein